jgi:uncharacterized membrane protein
MTWEQRYRLWQVIRTSLVPWAVLSLVAALIASPVVRWLDYQTGWSLFGFGPDGARAVLGALSGSMLTFIVFVLSATLIVVQLASGQMTPRIVALVFAMPWVKSTLAILTFTFAYTLAALARVEDRVPELHVGVAVFLNLGCTAVFFLFVQRLSSGLRPITMARLVADRTRTVIREVYPQTYDPKRPDGEATGSTAPSASDVVVPAERAGAVMAVGVTELVRLAREAGAVIKIVPQVGDYIGTGDALVRVSGAARPVSPDAVRGCVAVGVERTLDQDPRFGFRILVDIANRALSPAVNDPTTAVVALDQITRLLLTLGRQRLDDGRALDGDGKLRVVYGTPDWPDYVILAVSEIRHYGEGSLQVYRRLRAMLEHLIRELPEARRPPLEKELALLGSGARRSFSDEEDLKRAEVADQQGIGGSDA